MPLARSLPLLLLPAALAAQSPPPVPVPNLLGFALTGSTTLGSQYIFRGLSQTDGKPTVQAELDLAHPTGFYLSAAFSNISWFTDQNAGTASAPVALGSPGGGTSNSASVELDVFGGYKWGFAPDWTLDAGFFRYLYPGSYEALGAFQNPATTEAFLGLSYAWASLKASRVLSASCFGVGNAEGTTYLDLSIAVPVGGSGWTVLLHGGHTRYAALTGDNSPFDYSDARLGVAKEVKGYLVTLAGTRADTRARAADQETPVYENALGRNIGGNRLTLTVAKTF